MSVVPVVETDLARNGAGIVLVKEVTPIDYPSG